MRTSSTRFARGAHTRNWTDPSGRAIAPVRRLGPRFLPAQRTAITSLTALFEIEKVFYELKYELNNRPDWVWIPLRGIARLTEAVASGDA